MNKDSGGVYIIRNKVSLKTYIGSTLRLFKVRFGIHKSDLRNHNHGNRYLQYAWDKYGEDNFSFIVLESMPDSTEGEILDAEQWYFDNTKTHAYNKGGYNIGRSAIAGFAGLQHTDETKEKIRGMREGKNNPFYGKTHSAETIRKMTEIKTGKTNSPETRARISRSNSGEKCHLAKLTSEEVILMRYFRNTCNVPVKKLKEYFNTSGANVYRIINRQSWRHTC